MAEGKTASVKAPEPRLAVKYKAEIVKGLNAGDKVVAVGQLKLQSGAAVTISSDPPPEIPAKPPRY